MHGVSSLSLPFIKNDADVGNKSANKVADMSRSFNLHLYRDLQRLILNTCRQTWCASSYQMQPAPSPKRWIGKQTNTSSTEQHRKTKLRTNDTNQSLEVESSQVSNSRWRKQGSHKQTDPLRQLALCKAMGWGTRRLWLCPRPLQIRKQNLNVFSVKACAICLKWPPEAQFATCQLRTKCFDSQNLGTKLDLWMQQSGQSSNLPETTGQQHALLILGQNCKRWNLWFGLHASCGPTRSCLTNLANQLDALAGCEWVSTSVSRPSWCECSNLFQLEVLEMTQMNFAESCSCFLMGNVALLQDENCTLLNTFGHTVIPGFLKCTCIIWLASWHFRASLQIAFGTACTLHRASQKAE